MQADMDGSAVMSAVPSSSPAQRERSFTATAADRMRTNRSSSRISQRTPSKYSDEDSSKTAVKVGKLRTLDGMFTHQNADRVHSQSFEYGRLLTPTIPATTSFRSDSATAHAKSRRM
jgi:hypothetical protein